jgi:RNA polymerase sigma factor (sigma-70 family)
MEAKAVSFQAIEVYDNPAQNGKDYILQVKIKNGPLLRALRMRGFQNARQFCLKTGMPQTEVGKYLSLTRAPINRRGEWNKSALKLAQHLRLPPDSLFPEQHLERALAKASGEIEVSSEEVSLLIENESETSSEERERLYLALEAALRTLTPREERVIRLRFGLGCKPHSRDEVGERQDVSRERVRQIEGKAIRKLRFPSRAKLMADEGYAAADDHIKRARRRQTERIEEERRTRKRIEEECGFTPNEISFNNAIKFGLDVNAIKQAIELRLKGRPFNQIAFLHKAESHAHIIENFVCRFVDDLLTPEDSDQAFRDEIAAMSLRNKLKLALTLF